MRPRSTAHFRSLMFRPLLAVVASAAIGGALLLAPPAAAGSSALEGSGVPASAPEAPGAPASVQELSAPTPPAVGVPVTVPALQQWQPGGRDFVLKPGAIQLQVDPDYAAQLTADAHTFADDLHALTGRKVLVQTKKRVPGDGPGVIRMTLDPSWTEHSPEASRITVDYDVTIAGPTADGTFSGTRSVLQLLGQSDRIPGGVAHDWPQYAERSLMIDNGRKYFTPGWAEREIRELSYLKYNQFHWHIADNAGFRIESDTHPEIVSPEHWTKAQVRHLVAYAAKYHLEVIPELDMPGHMNFALRNHPDLQIADANGTRNANNLDPTNPAARTFVTEILDELIPLFPGRYIHTGGDEYTSDWNKYPVLTDWAKNKYGPDANSHDAVLDFTNYLDSIVTAHGKTMRIWNDGGQGGSQLQANKDIVLEYWSSQHGGVLAQDFLDQGYRITNADRDVLYDVPGSTTAYNNLDPREIFDQWDMTQYHPWIGENTTAPGADGVLGGQLHLWNDTPTAATEKQEAGRLQMPLRAMIQQLWGSPLNGGWDALAARALLVGTSPQWDLRTGTDQNLAHGALVWSSSRETPACHEAMLVDEDTSTRWCGVKTEPQSVVLDLGASADLGTVVLNWETAFASGYSLEVSDDLRSWTTVFATSTGDGKTDVLPVSGHGRYLRLSMTERGTKYGYSLYEIRAYPRGALVPTQFSAAVDPQTVLPVDGSATASITVTNSSSLPADVQWSAAPSAGVTVSPRSGTLQVPAGGSASADVRVSGGAEPGSATAAFTVTGRSLGETVELATAELLVTVPFPVLSAAFTGVGVTSDAAVNPPTLGVGFDGAGSSYSEQALAGAGVVPGTAFTESGVTVHWPDAAVATPNNVLANGQSVTIDAAGTAIGVLTAASYGPVSGEWVVHYTDGTSQTVVQSTPDWSSAPPAGSTVLATMAYRNSSSTGHTERRTQLFFQRIPVDPAKTVQALTLPVVSATAVRGQPALHVFDVAIG